jgi:hypothetical protein
MRGVEGYARHDLVAGERAFEQTTLYPRRHELGCGGNAVVEWQRTRGTSVVTEIDALRIPQDAPRFRTSLEHREAGALRRSLPDVDGRIPRDALMPRSNER